MGSTLRATRALVLLAGFHLLSLILLAALAAADWAAAVWTPSGVTAKVWFVSVLLAIPVVRGMFMIRTPKAEDPPGLPLTETAEPRLWALVRELADAAGTRAPDTILLTADVNASVLERSRLLGLLPGRRSLHLGLPLLTGLTEAQLRAVIAHEYGHFTGGDTRLSALVVRGRVQIARVISQFQEKAERTVAKERARQEKSTARRIAKGKKAGEVDTGSAGFTYRTMARLYTAYGKLYLRASLSTARAQEFAADLSSARLAGRDATASALREIPVLAAAHDFYLDSYATLGLPARALPPYGTFFGGFAEMLVAREAELSELREHLPSEEPSPYDSHPPIAERVRRVEELPDNGRAVGPDAATPALALLADPRTSTTALEDAVLTDEARAFRRAASWKELLEAAMAARLADTDDPAHRALALHTHARPTLRSFLQVIDEGQEWQLARRLQLSDEARAASNRAFREFARPMLTRALYTMVLAELSAQGLLRWEFSWSEPARAVLPGTDAEAASGTGPDPQAAALEAAVTAALADRPDTAPLRALLPPVPHDIERI